MKLPDSQALRLFMVVSAIVVGIALVRGITYALVAATGGPVATQATAAR
jgi:hypothetical protein